MANEYKVYVTGNDTLGYKFIQNLVDLANKGAVLEEGKVPRLSFPHSAWMHLKTDELLENKPGVQYQIIQENFTREQLDALEWPEFKAFVKKKHGIAGRDRQVMTTQYLKAAFGGDDPEVKKVVE